MLTVRPEVQKIVEQIDARRTETEGEKSQSDGNQFGLVENLMRQNERHEEEAVLHPLMNAQRLQPQA